MWIIAEIARYYARKSEEFLKPVKIESALGDAWIEHHALGVMLAVEPRNFPYYQLMRVFAPNFAAGNPVVFKHALSRENSFEPARRSSASPTRISTSNSRNIAGTRCSHTRYGGLSDDWVAGEPDKSDRMKPG